MASEITVKLLKYANVNHMANKYLFGFLLFSMTTLLQLGIYSLYITYHIYSLYLLTLEILHIYIFQFI